MKRKEEREKLTGDDGAAGHTTRQSEQGSPSVLGTGGEGSVRGGSMLWQTEPGFRSQADLCSAI